VDIGNGRIGGALRSSISRALVCLAAATALVPQAFAQQYLLNRLDVNVGSDPRGAATADFNNDGRPDLAVVNEGSNSVSVMLGQTAGAFGAASNYATGTGPYGIVAGDFNNDGNQDLAITNVFDDTVSILLGNGNGTFTIKSVPSVGSLPVAIVAGDFNNDGKLDLAVTNLAGNSVSVLLGKGDGTFQNQVTYALPANSEPRAIVTGFFNSDNSLDLVVVDSGTNLLSILLGSSSGTFTVQSTQPATGELPFWIATGDFNGDHIVDLAVANQCGGDPTCGTAAGTVSVLLGNGNGTFQSQVVFNVGAYPDYVWAGPLAINGPADIVTANSGSDTISVLISTGNNTFQNHQDYATGGFPYSLGSADFNGDGLPDFAISNAVSNTATILLGDGDGTFTERKVTSTGLAPEGVATGNLNGDSNLDAAVADSTANSVSILLGNGDGTFTAGSTLTTGTGPSGVVIADFNGDGILDVATSNTSANTVSVMLGTGGGSFQAHMDFATGASPVGLAAADVNNDGHMDLITANSAANTISVLLGTGNGTFNAHQDYAVGTTPVAVAAADFNKDGNQDLAVANSVGNTISILLGNGTGAFTTQTAYIVGYDPLGIAVGDMNNDSKLDVVTANSGGGSVAVLLGNGDGTFQKHVNFSVPGANNLSLGDFNGDGKLDVVATSSNGVASVLLGTAGGTLQPHIDFGLGTKPFAVATGNFDTAGGLDFIATSLGSNAVAVFVNLPSIGIYPPSFNFGTVGLGQQSTQTLTITNPGSTPLSVSSITTTGEYSENAENCVTTLQQGASCTAMITFAPTQSGTQTGTANISDNAPASPQVLSLTGAGGSSGVTLSPTSLNFGNVSVGTSSASMPVTLTNNSSATVTITNITTTSQYTQANTCGGSVGAGKSCTINVTFAPTQEGTVNGTLTVTDSASNSPQTATLTGVGTEPIAQLSPTSINFGDELINTTSPTQTVTLTNTGNATLNITSVTVSGAFLDSNKCSSTLSAGNSCSILVAFKPTGVGAFTGTLSVTDNAPGSPQTVSLSGSGTLVTLSPSSVNFGTVKVGQSSAPTSITVTNKSTNQTLSITGIQIGGANPTDFTQTNNCPSSLSPQTSCTVMVTFTPLVTGSLTAQLQVYDNGGGSPQTASLSGTGN
jgi:hypothetical protein